MSGSGGGGGYEYQARATAYVAVHILAEENLRWIENNNPDVPISVAGETGGVGDDLCITLRSGIKIELQAKHGLEKDKLWKPLIKIAKGLKADPKLYGVILTDSTASKTIREDLRNDFKRLGQGRVDNLKTITQETQQKFLDADLPDIDPEFFKRLVIIVLDLDQGLQDGKQAQLLLSRILHDRNQSAIVWEALCSTGQSLNTHEGCRDSKDWARLLCSNGVQLAADCAKANGVMSLEEKKYLESVKQKYQDWWEDSYAFMNEINDAKWQNLEITVKIPKSKLNNETNSLSASDGDDKTTILPILDALSQVSSKRVLIVGKAGAGKSTILAKVLLEAAEEALQNPISPIPVLIKLKDYQNQSDFLLLIRDAFERSGFLEEMQETEQIIYIKKLIKDKRLVLLADGVNELSGDGYRAFNYFCGDHLAMIATTRDINASKLDIQTKLEIQPLSAEKVKDFFSKKLPDYHDNSRVQELCDRVRDFGQTPLMVWMLYIIFKQNPLKEAPNTRGEAYREFTDIYSREAKDEVDWVVLTEMRSQLSILAFEMTCSEKPFNEGDVLNLIGVEKIRKNLLSNHLLQRDGTARSRKVRFCHPSLQEYYTAEYILARLPELTNKRDGQQYTPFQRDYLNHLKLTEAIAIMLGFPEITNSQSKQLVQMALDVDLMMGSHLVGEAKVEAQAQAVELVRAVKLFNETKTLETSDWLRVMLMGRTRSKFALSDLQEFLENPNIDIVRKAVSWIGVSENQEAIPILLNFLKSNERFIQEGQGITLPDQKLLLKIEIIEAIERLSTKNDFLKIKNTLNLHEFNNPWSSFLSFSKTDDLITKLDPESTKKNSLEVLIKSRDPNQIRQSSSLLSKLNYPVAVSQLISRLGNEQDKDVYKSLIDGLGKFNTRESISALVNLIETTNNSYREIAAKILIDNERFIAINELIPLLDNPNWDIRWCAADILGRFCNESAIPVLLEGLLGQHHRSIQISAAELLGLVKTDISKRSEIVSALVSSLNNPDYAVRRNAAISLANFNQQESIPELLKALRHYYPVDDSQINTEIVNFKTGEYSKYPIPQTTLESLGDRESIVKWILEDIYPNDSTNAKTRRQVVEALSKFNTEEVIKELYDVLQGNKLAAVALVSFGKQDAVSTLIKLLEEPSQSKIMDDLISFASLGNLTIASELISILQNINNYDHTDECFRNRVAIVLAKIEHNDMVCYLPDLVKLLPTEIGEQASWAIASIQFRCQFYNYEIACHSEPEIQKAENLRLSRQGTTVVNNYIDQSHSTIGVGYAAENSNIKFEQIIKDITKKD
jgi:HEAT repeat protein